MKKIQIALPYQELLARKTRWDKMARFELPDRVPVLHYIGARYWLRSLTAEQRARLDSDVNVDTIGVDGTYSWSNNSDRVMLDRAMEAATGAGLQLVEARLHGGDADSSVFRRARPPIPAITIFGASEDVIFDIIHSSRDTMDAFVFAHYKNTVLVLAALMKLLDRKPARAPSSPRA